MIERQCSMATVCGILPGDTSDLFSRYLEKIRERGTSVLTPDDFSNRFRRRFPNTHWGWAMYGTPEEYNIGRAVFVGLQAADADLIAKIDKWGWFEDDGYDAILETFISVQDQLSGDPLPDDELPL